MKALSPNLTRLNFGGLFSIGGNIGMSGISTGLLLCHKAFFMAHSIPALLPSFKLFF